VTSRRQFLAAAAAWSFAPRFARAESLPPHYRQPPPYFPYVGLIEPGHDEFAEEAAAMRPRTPRAARPAHTRFADITGAVLNVEQFSRGTPYWIAALDPASGIDIYANQGIAAGDADGDGEDEIYVCQPGGLPNKLLKWSGNRFRDITPGTGLDLLDNTSCALFLDLRNGGRQDLVVLLASGPILFLNLGNGRFQQVDEAFHFATSPAGVFTGMAAADYDRDGKLDLYCCCYSFFETEAQFRYPAPYHDARNGPPNFLFRNRLNSDGTGIFEDVTKAVGLDENNNRFSFAPAWCDYDGSGWPSLYVANDFGRNNLYRNTGGRFKDIAGNAGVEDIGPGMSACWFDENADGRPDLYVSNMWSESGQRVVQSKAFKNAPAPDLRRAWHGHTKGNSLYLNRGDGTFEDAGARLGVEMGRWAWSADAHDFDNDTHPEILITCGMISGGKEPDLMSFFWRQVVAKSPLDNQPNAAYENGWNAINQFIREGYSWNGHEPNVFYVRAGEKYRDASIESGLDVPADSRSFAVLDFDNDGCLDLVLKNRLGPQVQVFQNHSGQARQRVGFVLRGAVSNRDAIGARVQADGQTKWVVAGSGYLAQHTKRLYFGLDGQPSVRSLTVTWPSGEEQHFRDVAAGALYEITERGGIRRLRAFDAPAPISPASSGADNRPRLQDTWLREPLPLPIEAAGARLLILHGKEKPAAGPARYIDLLTAPDTLAAFSLFRRYLFEYRAPLDLPLALLLNQQGEVVKVYGAIPSAAQLEIDLKKPGAALPYAGHYFHSPRRDTFKIGAALLWSGYPEQALPYLESVLRNDSANVRTLVLVAQVHREAGRLAEAERRLQQALRVSPSSAEAWNEQGGVHVARQETEQALHCFERALAGKQDLTYALLNAAQAASKLGRLADAERYYRRAIAADPKSPDAHNGLGLALAQQNQPSEAEASLREAIRLKPDFSPAWNNLGVLYLMAGRREQAIRTLEEGIQSAPADDLLYLNLGRAYLQTGNREAALAAMRRLLAQKPDSETAKKALRELGAPPP